MTSYVRNYWALWLKALAENHYKALQIEWAFRKRKKRLQTLPHSDILNHWDLWQYPICVLNSKYWLSAPAKKSSHLTSKMCYMFFHGSGNPLQYPCLENPVNRGAWWDTVQGVAESWTWLRTHTHSVWDGLFLNCVICPLIKNYPLLNNLHAWCLLPGKGSVQSGQGRFE